MGYTARNLDTNEVFYSKGASRIANLVGCNPSTITKFFNKKENKCVDKTFRGWLINKVEEIPFKNRGSNIKFFV